MNGRWQACRREPFRILFPLGVAFGCLGVSHWLAFALGWLETASGFYHASIQVGAYMYCFIAGFLMTALPKFAKAAPASNAELLCVLLLLAIQATLLSLGAWILAQTCYAGLLVFLVVFAGRRVAGRHSGVGPPTELFWVPIGVVLGLVGTGLLIVAQIWEMPSWVIATGRPMAQQGFLVAVVTGVAGFMAPRLMGRGYLQVTPAGVSGPDGLRCAQQADRVRRTRVMLHALAAIALAGSFAIEGIGFVGPAYLVRALVVTVVWVVVAQVHRPPAVSDYYVKLLWMSLWMVLIGLWGAGLFPRYRVAMLHLVFLGGFSLMTFAVGVMVVLTHAGEGLRLRQRLGVLRIAVVGIGVAMVARVTADFWSAWYYPAIALASCAWLIVGLSWLVYILPRVARPVQTGEFEQVHEAAKQRLLRMTKIKSA